MNYYVCDIIGDGLSEETAYRPSLADEGVSFSVAAIPTINGAPAATWVLVKTGANVSRPDSRPLIPPVASDTAREKLNDALIEMGVTPDISAPEYIAALEMLSYGVF